MEAKKTVSTTMATPAAKRKSAMTFFGEMKQEFKTINWTEKDELMTYTKVVIGATFLCGIGIYVVDLVIQGLLHAIGYITTIGG
ncbi:MAG: preprotein translocase subunit SecE [Parachlamydiales bacterium]|nr:preprotein translocase subunit SecE [Parachlamydiales bacterium]